MSSASEHTQDTSIQLTIPSSFPPSNQIHDFPPSDQIHDESQPFDYVSRAQWLRAAVLGATDGLISVASIMIGVGAVNGTTKAMLVSGLAGLIAGACSMAIGEFMSVYTQYDIEVAQMEREKIENGREETDDMVAHLPSPIRAAVASFIAFAMGAILPLLSGGFIHTWSVRIGVVCAATSLGLAGFGAAGAMLGRASVWRSMARVLVGGWVAMIFTYGVIKVFGIAFGLKLS
ncbi:vacuolar iron transporter homolog 2-like [Magnolia sinica]|uniref:vacuolar iron transporter homolog 2-like n=1 Tax=Magnolia sinica TaxID=86752 RepID=UPI0026598D4D|nr:vacuolar iron transporter homolog 2-like [Magnolia sinica]